ARRVLDEIRSYGRVRAAYPGLQVQSLTPYLARRLGFADARGLVVSRVDPDGPAARAGVRVGDRLRRVNGLTIDSVDDAQKSIYGASVGDRLKLTIERGGRALEVELTLVQEHRWTPMVGRTHGIHAEPITFGLKCLVWCEELGRDLKRLRAALKECAVGKFSGAVGTLAHIDPAVEVDALGRLGLTPEPVA